MKNIESACFGISAESKKTQECLMVVGRLISGVHWLTDILGGVLLSVGLVMFYAFAMKRQSSNISVAAMIYGKLPMRSDPTLV